ncbi:MAG: BLUF domain-containing protein [Chloroflexota bacterium]
MPLVTLVYFSVAYKKEVPDAELMDILTIARKNNKTLNVTGMLLYRDGFFIQALEGEQAIVEDLYTKIAQDSRHKNIITVYQNEISKRLFMDWFMGFNRLEDRHLADIEGYDGVVDAEFFATKPGRVTSLLETFRNRPYF